MLTRTRTAAAPAAVLLPFALPQMAPRFLLAALAILALAAIAGTICTAQ
jgi:hypothetical protein